MTEKQFVPQEELAEEALEQVSGGEGWIVTTDPNDPILFQPGFVPTKEA